MDGWQFLGWVFIPSAVGVMLLPLWAWPLILVAAIGMMSWRDNRGGI